MTSTVLLVSVDESTATTKTLLPGDAWNANGLSGLTLVDHVMDSNRRRCENELLPRQ